MLQCNLRMHYTVLSTIPLPTEICILARRRRRKKKKRKKKRRWVSFGLAVRRYAGKQKGLGSIQLRLSLPFRKVVVGGHCLVTLSLTVNETLKWLSSLPILMQESFWWWQCSDRYITYLFPPPPPLSLSSMRESVHFMVSAERSARASAFVIVTWRSAVR